MAELGRNDVIVWRKIPAPPAHHSSPISVENILDLPVAPIFLPSHLLSYSITQKSSSVSLVSHFPLEASIGDYDRLRSPARSAPAQGSRRLETAMERPILGMVSIEALPILKYHNYSPAPRRFYVNLHTRKSTWEKPTAPALPGDDRPPPYARSDTHLPDKSSHLESNNPYGAQTSSTIDENADRRYASQLQAEQDARASGARPTSRNGYANTELPPQEHKSKGISGLLSKVASKVASSQHGAYGGHGQYGSYPPSIHGGIYPRHQVYGYPAPHGPPLGGGLGGLLGGHRSGYGAYPARRPGGGMGMAGAGALGLGAGMLGGAMMADAIDDSDGGYGGGSGSDYGGDDYGGGDDFGGGDFGGGDFGGD